jgi:hypothetical protein
VIDALWRGFIDLRHEPERIVEISEAAAFPPLAALLQALNAADSPVWTAKCDLWEPERAAQASQAVSASGAWQPVLACYIDLLPREGQVFAHWQQAEALCRKWCTRLAQHRQPEFCPECRIDLVIRQAIAGTVEGFGITAYISAGKGSDRSANAALATALVAFADAILTAGSAAIPASKLQ